MIDALRLSPLLPAWALVLVAIAGGAMVWRIWRGAGIASAALRAGAAIALIGALAGPSRVIPSDEGAGAPGLTILIDTSGSMAVCDVPSPTGAAARLDAVRPWIAPDLLRRLDAEARVRLLTFDDAVRPMDAPMRDLEADGEATDLAGALALVVGAGAPGEVVLAMTDGADSAGSPLDAVADLALARGVRIDAAVPGVDQAPLDSAVTLRAAESLLFAGASTELVAMVRADAPAHVRIIELAPGRIDRVVDERIVAPAAGAAQEVRVTVTPPIVRRGAVGTVVYRAAIDADPTDADPTNNEALASVQVSDAPIRVLALEARPSWEMRFFLDALRDDPRVAVTSVGVAGGRDRVLVSGPGGAADAPEALAVDAESLARFDVIALGRGVERWFPGARAADLVRAVELGAGLVFLRADPVIDDARARTVLEAISPVAWGDERLVGGRLFATFEGRAESPVAEAVQVSGDPYLQYLPEALATSVSEGERTLSAVWLRSEAPGADPAERAPAAIAHQPVGQGQTLAILTDGLWRWAFAPPSRDEARRAYRAFWAQAIRVLAGAGDLPPGAELAVTAADTPVGEPAPVAVRARPGSIGDAAVTLETINPSGVRASAPLTRAMGADRWSASFTPDAAGPWRIIARAPSINAQAETVIHASAVDPERMATRARPDRMRALAEATGGALLDLERPDAMLGRLPAAGADSEAAESLEPLWRHPALLIVIGALLLIEWALRRLRGGV
ncbi:MAG: hypothetical protein ACF8QF_10150 [Phycisphaerales bacterium]